MGLFSKKKAPVDPWQTGNYKPIPSSAKTTKQWQAWEAERGCVTCGKKGCHRMRHSYTACGRCGSAYCNGDACPGYRHGR